MTVSLLLDRFLLRRIKAKNGAENEGVSPGQSGAGQVTTWPSCTPAADGGCFFFFFFFLKNGRKYEGVRDSP